MSLELVYTPGRPEVKTRHGFLTVRLSSIGNIPMSEFFEQASQVLAGSGRLGITARYELLRCIRSVKQVPGWDKGGVRFSLDLPTRPSDVTPVEWDFAQMVSYVLTNTDLLLDDPRITFVDAMKASEFAELETLRALDSRD